MPHHAVGYAAEYPTTDARSTVGGHDDERVAIVANFVENGGRRVAVDGLLRDVCDALRPEPLSLVDENRERQT